MRSPTKNSPCLSKAILFLFSCLLSDGQAGIGVFNWKKAGCAAVWEQDGLRVTNSRGTICAFSDGINAVSNGSVFSNDVGGLHIVHTQGQTFTPLTIEIAEYSQVVRASPVSFFGTKANGKVVNFTITLDGICDGPGGQPDFQTVTFPAEFKDLIKLDVPSMAWSFDNFVFSTVIPYTPANPSLEAGFRQVQALTAAGSVLVIGPDFHYASDFRPPTSTQFLRTEDSTSFWTPGVSFDSATQNLYFISNQTIHRYRDHAVTDIITLQQVANAGYDVQWLFLPRGSGDQVYFAGGNTTGNDFYFIFKLDPKGGLAPIITPDTLLPGRTGPDLPYYFPDLMTVRDSNFAFNTSLRSNWQTDRVFASWNGGPLQEVLAVDNMGPLGRIPSIDGLEFDDNGKLMVQTGDSVLICDADGTIESEVPLVVYPIKRGKAVSGKVIREADGSTFLQTTDEIYRKYGDDYYRLIGVGDLIDGEPITSVRYLDKPLKSPLRIIVEVRLPSSPSTGRSVELLLGQKPSLKLPPEAWMFDALDLDENGVLSFEEWLQISTDSAVPGLFAWIDSDNSDEIDLAELVTATGSKMNRLLNQWMSRFELAADLDIDGDFHISREEIGLMWKPGTAAWAIDPYLIRAKAVFPMTPSQWLEIKKLPNASAYSAAKTMRSQRRAVAAQLDADENGRIDLEEFADLFPVSTKRSKIDKAWLAATGTIRGKTAPDDLSIEDFVEAPSLPKLPKI